MELVKYYSDCETKKYIKANPQGYVMIIKYAKDFGVESNHG